MYIHQSETVSTSFCLNLPNHDARKTNSGHIGNKRRENRAFESTFWIVIVFRTNAPRSIGAKK